MVAVTLRPDSTVFSYFTVTNAPTIHQCTNDNSDSSYLMFASGGATPTWFTFTGPVPPLNIPHLGFGTVALPAGAAIRSAVARVRCAQYKQTGYTDQICLRLHTSNDGSSPYKSTVITNFPPFSSSPGLWDIRGDISGSDLGTSLNNPAGLTAQQAVDALTMSLSEYSVGSSQIRVYEAYIDLVYDEISVATIGTIPTTTPRPAIPWTYAQSDSRNQKTWDVAVWTNADTLDANFPASNPFVSSFTKAAGGTATRKGGSSGTGAATFSYTLESDLISGTTYKAFVRTGHDIQGQTLYSAIANSTFTPIVLSTATPAPPTVSWEAGSYRVALQAYLNANLLSTNQANVETDLTGFFSVSNVTLARTTAAGTFLSGIAALRMTSVGAGTVATAIGEQGAAASGRAAVIANMTYTAAAWFKSAAVSRTCQVFIDWYNSAGAYISSSARGSATSTTTGWTQAIASGQVAPAGATTASVRLDVIGAAGASEVHYADQMGLMASKNLAYNADAEQVIAGLLGGIRQNLFTNPISANNATGWLQLAGTGGTAALTRQTGQSGWFNGATTSARTTWSVGTSSVSGGILWSPKIAGLTPGSKYSAMLLVRCNKIQRVMAYINWYTTGGTFLSATTSADVVLAANTATAVGLTAATAPATATQAELVVDARVGTSGTNWANGDWLEATNAIFEETDQQLNYGGGSYGPAQNFFHGGFLSGDYGNPAEFSYGWSGTAHASTSYMYAPALDQYTVNSSAGVNVTRSSEVTPVYGSYVGRISWPTAAAGGVGDGQAVVGMTIGVQYYYSVYVWIPTGSPDVGLSVDGITLGGTVITTGQRNQWVRLSGTFTATATSHTFRIINWPNATVKGDDRCYFDAVQIEANSSVTGWAPGGDIWTRGGFQYTSVYKIQRSADNGVTWEYVWLHGSPSYSVYAANGIMTFYDGSAKPNTTYLYRIVSNPVAGDDGVYTPAVFGYPSAPVTTTSTKWILRDPSDVSSVAVLQIAGDLESESPDTSGTFLPLGRTKAVVVGGQTYGEQFRIPVIVKGTTDRDLIESYRSRGKILLLQSDTTEKWWVRFNGPRGRRLINNVTRKTLPVYDQSLELVEVDAPTGYA